MTLKETRTRIERQLKELELKHKGKLIAHTTVDTHFLIGGFKYVTVVTLCALYVEDKGVGTGTAFIQELKNIADSFEATIALTSTRRSEKFYRKHGFKKSKELTFITNEELFYRKRR